MTNVLKPGRSPGWAKLRSTLEDRQGSLNIEWDAGANVLQCRVVNRGSGRPNLIVGDFLDYVLRYYRRCIRCIVISPRR